MIDVVMPQMGESIVEGTLTKWLKKPGDRVERDEPLFEISTDKVDTEIPSPAAGILKDILVEEGKTAGINTVVGRLDDAAGATASAPAAAAPAPQPAAQPAPPAPAPTPLQTPPPQAPPAPADAGGMESGGEVVEEPQGPLSPLVRKMARDNNIDLSKVRGTGAGGRITKQDVENFIAAQGVSQAPPPPPPPAPAPVYTPPAPPVQVAPQPPAPAPAPVPQAPPPAPVAAPAPQAPAIMAGPRTRVEPLSNMRQKIAEHMVFSKHTSAHVTTVHRVDMTKVAKVRARSKDEFQARNGFGLTFLPFFTRAAANALRDFPIVNASLDDRSKSIVYHNDINIGIAVALDGGSGLIVPVIRNADEKNVLGLQRSIVDLSTRARSRQLRPDEVAGGTFSITNFGSFGSIFATPVINQPQVAILGVGAVTKEPVVVDDMIAIRSMCYVALTFDHRLIDGALADQFCQKVKAALEGWSEQVL
jgi:2-oxoglutarate dehydrogenase E2 component (dihydrolipoamide succinyltransferase)